jgi:hypothetical protein
MGVSVKALKRMLKKKGLKTTGRKAALTRRAKKAMRGGEDGVVRIRVKLILTDTKNNTTKATDEFVAEHAPEIMSWLAEQNQEDNAGVYVKYDEKTNRFIAQKRYDPRDYAGLTPEVKARKLQELKAEALTYFNDLPEPSITIEEEVMDERGRPKTIPKIWRVAGVMAPAGGR